MKKLILTTAAVVLAIACGSVAQAQVVTSYYMTPSIGGPAYAAPVVTSYYRAPAAFTYRPAVGYVAPTLPTTTYYAPATTSYYAPTTTYYAPATTSYYAPATTSYYAPTTTYYAPATTSYYAPTTSYYAPATSAYYAPAVTSYYAPTYYGRPAAAFYSGYGGPEVRVAGQPVLNTLRTIIP